MKRFILLLGLIFAAAVTASAAKFVEREFTCPVCGHSFYAKLDVGDAPHDIRLDLKPIGDVPAPWLLPDCPACGFIIYSINIPKAELARARAITASEDYKKNLQRSSYFRLGLLYAGLDKPPFVVANAFLRAAWQEENDPIKIKEDLGFTLKYFTACAKDEKSAVEERENSQLLMGELLRRLGRFEEATAHLKGLQGIKGFQNNFFADVVAYELKLSSEKDAAIYEMEDVRSFKRPLLDQLKWQVKKLMRKYNKE